MKCSTYAGVAFWSALLLLLVVDVHAAGRRQGGSQGVLWLWSDPVPRHGYGTYTWLDGRYFEGYWENSKEHGQGTLTYANGGNGDR